jgi:hypothetical protein
VLTTTSMADGSDEIYKYENNYLSSIIVKSMLSNKVDAPGIIHMIHDELGSRSQTAYEQLDWWFGHRSRGWYGTLASHGL